ncbi:unknown [Firmicutes bacterium CAG:534]|nr:unknown [Firmicutes bacterium CAG:534]
MLEKTNIRSYIFLSSFGTRRRYGINLPTATSAAYKMQATPKARITSLFSTVPPPSDVTDERISAGLAILTTREEIRLPLSSSSIFFLCAINPARISRKNTHIFCNATIACFSPLPFDGTHFLSFVKSIVLRSYFVHI